jgi:hypothetical protein
VVVADVMAAATSLIATPVHLFSSNQRLAHAASIKENKLP